MCTDETLSILEKLGTVIEKLNKETYSLEEAALYLKTTVETVEYYSKRKKQLSHVCLSGSLVFRKKDLDEFLEKKLKKAFVF